MGIILTLSWKELMLYVFPGLWLSLSAKIHINVFQILRKDAEKAFQKLITY